MDSLVLHSVTGKQDDAFVGLKYIGNKVHLYHPECYRMDKNSPALRSDILSLLKTISIAKTASVEHSKAYNTQSKGGEFALFSYLWIINDYLAKGFYVNKEKTYIKNRSGKINWKRTMQSAPVVSNGNLIFPEVIAEQKSSIDNLLVEVHRFCVKKSLDYIGWLFNISSDFIQVPRFSQSLKKVYLNAIHQELNRTFLDDKRLLLTHMKNVINGLDESANNKEFVYGVDSYNYVFERMIDAIFCNVDRISDFYPTAKWALQRENFREFESSKLRPDTIILKEKSDNCYDAFILDAKFYRFGYTGDASDLPETTSIQKQITYGEYLRKNAKVKVDQVYSAFVLPYDCQRQVFACDHLTVLLMMNKISNRPLELLC